MSNTNYIVYRQEDEPKNKRGVWIHHKVYKDLSSPIVVQVYSLGMWQDINDIKPGNAIKGLGVKNIISLNKEEYESLVGKDPETLYFAIDYSLEEPSVSSYLGEMLVSDSIKSVTTNVEEPEYSESGPQVEVGQIVDGVLPMTFKHIQGPKGDTGDIGPKGEKGDQGNTGSSVDYPYELVNNVTTDDATKGLSAAQGVVLDGKISQLGQQVIYDVTMNNSNHPTFASLLALLSDANLSTLIPANVRCGGMSIRFVQTSDNKYVQYRYLKATVTAFDFTQTYNWQGVDDEPVAGYDEYNLVKSIGVGNKIMLLNIVSDSAIKKDYKLKANASYHIRNNSTSAVTISRRVEYNGTAYDIVNVVGKATIVYTPTGDGNYLCAGSACNLDVCPVDSIIDKVAFAEEYSDNVPTTNSKNVVKSGGVKTAIDEVVVKIDNVANAESPLQALDGYINTSTSTLDETVITGNFAHYIGNCVEGDRFIITGRGGESPLLWSFWDSNNQKISASNYNVEATNLELTAPENAAKVVFNSSKNVVFSFNQLVPETQQEQDIKIEEISNSVRRIRETINVRNLTYPADAYTSLDKTFKRGSRINISANFNNVGEDVYFTIFDKDGNTLGYRYKSAANFSKEIIATFEIANIIIYFPSTVTSGTKMSNIKIEVLTDVVMYDELNSQFLSSGNYQFGLKGDGAYHCQSIPALPQQSETNCAYFYALYDALVAQHPNYITKVDCDAEMVAQGYTRPSELSNLPIYMYKFIPKYAPSVFSGNYKTQKSRLKVYIVTGTHPEYMGIYDTYQTMRLICEQWENNDNLQELRWNAEFYIIPCSGPYGINMGSRTNYNGVDLNRNAPSNDWRLAGYGTDDYSGPEPASEYETKLMMYYFEQIKPNIFIDHHNMDSVSKVLIWPSCRYPFGVDVAASLIADMTAAWKKRSQTQDEDFAGVFPSNNDDDTTMFGVAQYGDDPGMRSSYASDNGAIGFTYESQASISYANGEFDASHRQTRTKLCCTCATEGFINFLYRLLKSYSIRFDA